MATIEYSLFRAKMIISSQRQLFSDQTSSREVFERALEERPSAELNPGRTWHIGNLAFYSKDTGYFAFGRTTSTTNTTFDEVTGNFVAEDFETSPYTHVVFNAAIGFVGIAHTRKLARHPTGIAAKLEEVLQGTTVAKDHDVEVRIAAISDPEGFLKNVERAYRVLRFSAQFTGPNPFDADEYFQKPLSVYASAANATKGKAQISGDNLKKEVVTEVARSTAASGNKATAQIQLKKSSAPVTIALTGDPLKRSFDESTHDPKAVVKELTALYKEVRHDG